MCPAIRPTQAADLASITAIYAEAVTHGTASFELAAPTLEEMRSRMEVLASQGYPTLSLIEHDLLIGYAYAGPYRARPAYRWTVENSIYLDGAARGKGHGKMLLLALIEACSHAGFRQMIAVIGDSANHGSIALHQSCAFETIGTLKTVGWKHGKWLDTVFMQLELGEGSRSDAEEMS